MTTVEVIEQVVSVVEITETEAVLQTVESVQVVELGIQGPQGPPGAAGAIGGAYEHTQLIAADVWTIPHGLGYKPNVHIQDSLGRDVTGEVSHTDLNTMVLTFSAILTGSAALS